MKKTLLFLLILTSFSFSQLPSSIKWWHLSQDTKDSLWSIYFVDSTKQIVSDSLGWQIAADTTELKQKTASDGRYIYLKQLSASNPNGGGWFVWTDSAYIEGVIAFDPPIAGKQWVRVDYLKDKRVNLKWAGGLGNSLTDNSSAFNKIKSFKYIYVPYDTNNYMINSYTDLSGSNDDDRVYIIGEKRKPTIDLTNITGSTGLLLNNVYIENIKIIADNSLSEMFQVDSNFTAVNCEFDGLSSISAISNSPFRNSRFEKSKILNIPNTANSLGIKVYDGTGTEIDNIKFINTRFENINGTNLSLVGVINNVLIDGSEFMNNAQGTGDMGISIYSPGVKNCRIVNSYFKTIENAIRLQTATTAGDYTFDFDSSSSVIINNNFFEDVGSGVRVEDGNVTVSNNYFWRSSDAVTGFNFWRLIVTGNKMMEIGGTAIGVWDSSAAPISRAHDAFDVTISNNQLYKIGYNASADTFYAFGGHGIQVKKKSKNVIIADNIIRKTAGVGINANAATGDISERIRISGNIIDSVGLGYSSSFILSSYFKYLEMKNNILGYYDGISYSINVTSSEYSSQNLVFIDNQMPDSLIGKIYLQWRYNNLTARLGEYFYQRRYDYNVPDGSIADTFYVKLTDKDVRIDSILVMAKTFPAAVCSLKIGSDVNNTLLVGVDVSSFSDGTSNSLSVGNSGKFPSDTWVRIETGAGERKNLTIIVYYRVWNRNN